MKKTKNTTATSSRKAYFRLRQNVKAKLAAAKKKWADECRPLIRQAKTVEEAEAAYRTAPFGTPVKILALKKWATLCTEPDELNHAYHVSRRRFNLDNPAMQKWADITRKEADEATTLEEAERAFIRAPHWSWEENDVTENMQPLAKDYTFTKLCSLCTTIEKLQRYYKRHLVDSSSAPGESLQIYHSRFEAISRA